MLKLAVTQYMMRADRLGHHPNAHAMMKREAVSRCHVAGSRAAMYWNLPLLDMEHSNFALHRVGIFSVQRKN